MTLEEATLFLVFLLAPVPVKTTLRAQARAVVMTVAIAAVVGIMVVVMTENRALPAVRIKALVKIDRILKRVGDREYWRI